MLPQQFWGLDLNPPPGDHPGGVIENLCDPLGPLEGFPLGSGVGAPVGSRVLGEPLGLLVGQLETEGLADGVPWGIEDTDGLSVGFNVGNFLGSRVGDGLGPFVGDELGDSLGPGVGAWLRRRQPTGWAG